MFSAIPRGIIYHDVWFDVRNLVRSLRTYPPPDTVSRFEEAFARYMDMPHAIAFPFARSAVYAALSARNFPAGSEIIMPPITVKPMMDVVLQLGLRPVLVDIDLDTLCFDRGQLEKAVTPATRAVLLTYLFGIVPDVDELIVTARKHGLFIVEDFSHCLNAEFCGRKLGTFGDVGVYSCSSTKTFDLYGGGLAITADAALAEQLRAFQARLCAPPPEVLRGKILLDLLRNVFSTRPVFSAFTLPLFKLLARMNPVMMKKLTGARLNLQPTTVMPTEWLQRFTPLQADAGLELIGRVQALDDVRIAHVEKIKGLLDDLPSVRFPRVLKDARHVYWQFIIYADDPLKLQTYLHRFAIDTSTTNLSLIPALGIYPYRGDVPRAAYVHRSAVFIPAYPSLSDEDVQRVAEGLRTFFGSQGN